MVRKFGQGITSAANGEKKNDCLIQTVLDCKWNTKSQLQTKMSTTCKSDLHRGKF